MNREGAEKIKGALKIVSEQCRAAHSCDKCPLVDCCARAVGVFNIRPDYWFSGGAYDERWFK